MQYRFNWLEHYNGRLSYPQATAPLLHRKPIDEEVRNIPESAGAISSSLEVCEYIRLIPAADNNTW